MTDHDFVRRSGYTPGNHVVGRRGRRTRDLILEQASRLFVDQGYHGASIDAIARAVGGSRATVYQYFRDKEQILVELLHRCEPEMLAHAEDLGRLGPDAEGFAALRAWVVQLADYHDRYPMVFAEIPVIGMNLGVPVAKASAMAERYSAVIHAKVRDADVRGLDSADAAGALLRISHMVNLYRARGWFGLESPTTTSESLAVCLQLMLFPGTPARAFATSAVPKHGVASAVAPGRVHPRTNPDPGSVSPIRQDMLYSASNLFASRGYHAVSMDDIAEAADVSRATLYNHFSTKVNILAELTDWALMEGEHLSAELDELAEGGADTATLHTWLSKYVHSHRTYGGVVRAWHDGTVAQQLPEDKVSEGLGAYHRGVSALLAQVQLPPGVDERVATAVFLAVLGRLTEMTVSHHRTSSDYEAARFLTVILQRALLGRNAAFASPPK